MSLILLRLSPSKGQAHNLQPSSISLDDITLAVGGPAITVLGKSLSLDAAGAVVFYLSVEKQTRSNGLVLASMVQKSSQAVTALLLLDIPFYSTRMEAMLLLEVGLFHLLRH